MIEREEVTKRVEEMLDAYCQQKIHGAEKIGPGYVTMWQEIKTYLSYGGKRIRPYLAWTLYSAYGGVDEDTISPVATSLELLHACLLVHDDIIDRDVMRHGKPNIAGSYQDIYKSTASDDAGHYATSTALLAGDLLLAASYDIVNSSDMSSENKVAIHSFLQNALFATAGGQLLDVESVLYPLKDSNPSAVAEYKTAVYSFQLPMICGASVAGAQQDDIIKLEQLGLEAGVAFQLRDDLLGVFGTEGQTGKSNSSDISEKKRTLLINLAYQGMSTVDADRLEYLYGKGVELNDAEVSEVFKMISGTGAKNEIMAKIEEHSNRAKEIIATLSITVEYKKLLETLIDKLAGRLL